MGQESVGTRGFLPGELAEKQRGRKKGNHAVGHGDINVWSYAGFFPGK